MFQLNFIYKNKWGTPWRFSSYDSEALTAKDADSITGWETKIPQIME